MTSHPGGKLDRFTLKLLVTALSLLLGVLFIVYGQFKLSQSKEPLRLRYRLVAMELGAREKSLTFQSWQNLVVAFIWGVCILLGGLVPIYYPYEFGWEAYGKTVHYLVCGSILFLGIALVTLRQGVTAVPGRLTRWFKLFGFKVWQSDASLSSASSLGLQIRRSSHSKTGLKVRCKLLLRSEAERDWWGSSVSGDELSFEFVQKLAQTAGLKQSFLEILDFGTIRLKNWGPKTPWSDSPFQLDCVTGDKLPGELHPSQRQHFPVSAENNQRLIHQGAGWILSGVGLILGLPLLFMSGVL